MSGDLVTGAVSAPLPQPRITARRIQTRERLMAAAIEVFTRRGVISASVEEICEVAGFTRGAFYSNFADKNALVLALIESSAAQDYTTAEEAVAEVKSSGAELLAPEVVAVVLDQVSRRVTSGRMSLLAQQELLLYAAREPTLRAPYQAFVKASRLRAKALIVDALAFAGLQFSVPVDVALDLLLAVHDAMRQNYYFTDELDPTAMHTLIERITSPAA